MRKIWDIPGGVHPPENKSQSNHSPIASIPLPSKVILPLGQHIGAEALATVQVGDKVLKGQRIADAQGFVSAPIHASTSGVVRAIERRPISHPSGLEATCIVIESDGEDRWCDLTPLEDYTGEEIPVLLEKIRQSGIAGLGGAGFPTSVKLQPRGEHTIDTLILNGTECEPYITADDMLMRERAHDIVSGAQLIAHLLGHPANVLIGIEDNKPEAIAAVRAAAKDAPVEVVSFPTKYPSGGEKQLIQILTGREVPSGGLPAELGIVVQNVGTAAAAWRAVRFGEPLVSRVTTVVGEALGLQRNIDVLIGTPLDHILQHHGFRADKCGRLIIGGPMMGYAVDNSHVPLVKTTNCIMAPSIREIPDPSPAQPCIRCGMCAEACPAGLLPQQLFWFAQAEEVDKLKSHNLFDCIECGACSYVCPSQIPLVQYYRASKGIIRQIDEDKVKSDRSRERFEFRKARQEKIEAEKEAKRLARKKAAEEAKKKLAEDKSKAESTATAPESKSTTTGATTTDDAALRAKAERAVASAKNRVEKAQRDLNEAEQAGDTSRIESLQAKLKDAEHRQQEAQQKLSTLDQGKPATASAAIQSKLSMTPLEKQEKSVATLRKRVATADEKYREASAENSPTAAALQTGLAKLQQKLAAAEAELAELQKSPSNDAPETATGEQTVSAAEAAIAKAQAKAAAIANMSEDEKAKAQLDALRDRLSKAQKRLKKAEDENSEHIDAFRNGVEKLELKVKEAESAL